MAQEPPSGPFQLPPQPQEGWAQPPPFSHEGEYHLRGAGALPENVHNPWIPRPESWPNATVRGDMPQNVGWHSRSQPGVYSADDLPLYQRFAIALVGGMGSWKFFIVQTLVVVGWITLNVIAFRLRWDPYPFILLNLALSTQASYAVLLILMAQKLSDRRRDELAAHDYDRSRHQLDLLERIATKLEVD